MTTPISRSEIIRQKTRGLARLIKILWVPFLTLFLLGTWARSVGVWGRVGQAPGLYLLASCLTVLIYLPLLGWLATLLGLRSRNRLAAFMLFLACVIVWFTPPLIAYAGGARMGAHLDLPGSLFLLSPITMVLVAESSIQLGVFDLSAIALNAVIHGYILYRLRRACLKGAERYLHAT